MQCVAAIWPNNNKNRNGKTIILLSYEYFPLIVKYNNNMRVQNLPQLPHFLTIPWMLCLLSQKGKGCKYCFQCARALNFGRCRFHNALTNREIALTQAQFIKIICVRFADKAAEEEKVVSFPRNLVVLSWSWNKLVSKRKKNNFRNSSYIWIYTEQQRTLVLTQWSIERLESCSGNSKCSKAKT